MVQENAKTTVLQLELEHDQVEWVAFNPQGKTLRLGKSQLTTKLVYLTE